MSLEEELIKYGEDLVTNGWNVDPSGVWKTTEKKTTYACAIPILPTALLENMDSRTEKVEISFYKHGRWKHIVVPRSTIASNNTIVKLADDGVEVTALSSRNLMQYLSEVIAENLESLPHKPAKSVLGWVDNDEFVPYTDTVTFDGDDNFKYLFRAVDSKGSQQEWIDYMADLRTNRELRLCMATSFASPLIERIGENPFVMHLWGGTGSGKTVALLVAMSIWGNPAMGQLTRTMNMTANSMLSTAAFLRNLPFAGDELQTIKNRWGNYDNLIMQITEGIDRGRMSYDRVNEIKSWKCSFLFSGEEPCIKAASGGGAKNRVIEVECTGKLIKNGNAVANFVKTHYGTVGKDFIDAVKAADVQKMYTDYFNEILSKVDTTDKQAGAMALMLTADAIASLVFWPDEKPLTVNDIKSYLCSASEVDIAERAYQYISDTIAENAQNFQSDARSSWGQLDLGEGAAYINRTVLERVLNEAGFDFGAVQGKWMDRGYIVRRSTREVRWIKRINGIPTSCVKLKLQDADTFDDYKEDNLPL